jgi:hypothetical protein
MAIVARCQRGAAVILRWRYPARCSSYVTGEDCFEHNVGVVGCRGATSFGGKKLGFRRILNRSVEVPVNYLHVERGRMVDALLKDVSTR